MSAYPGIQLSSAATSAPLEVSPPQNVFWQAAPAYCLGLICTVSPGASLTYSVQVTADPTPVNNGNWNNHDVLVNQNASFNSNIDFPVTAIRLVVNTYTNGTVNLGVAQWP